MTAPDASQNAPVAPPTVPSSSSLLPRNIPPSASPPASRSRNPVAPSPLSKLQSAEGPPIPPSSPQQHSPPQALALSPCFIHSHLDQSGTLADWLSHRQHDGPPRHHAAPQPHVVHRGPHNGVGPVHKTHPQHSLGKHHPYHPSSTPKPISTSLSAMHSNGSSRLTSPTKREGSLSTHSGYESDKSSNAGNGLNGSAILDGDGLEDDEEGGSLTRQLAETAQGVREMSKELGRTKVRSKIQHILIVTKARDNRLIKLTRELALYLMLKRPAPIATDSANRPIIDKNGDRGMVVYVDAQLRHSKRFDAAGLQREYPQLFEPVMRRRSSSSTSISTYPSSTSVSDYGRRKDEGQLRFWTSEMCSNSPHLFDFVVTLGGDGTVLFTSWLFQRIVPPVLPFALGSLGFLTNFDFSNHKATMDKVVDEGIRVNLRMRFTCTVYRAIAPEEQETSDSKGSKRKAIKKPGGEILMSQVGKAGWSALEGPPSLGPDCSPCVEKKDKEIMCYSTRPVEQFEVLNDLVVDRGPSPFVSLLELFGDEHHLTTVQADGLCISTPTGSTAYSLSAGGSLVHPQIPTILITPICPHTLSFRPMQLPDSMELRVCVPYNSRSTAWASFDGRGRVELKQGDHIKISPSKYPFPTVCADKASTDWFSSISRTLRWNEREKQKSFVVVEEDHEPAARSSDGRAAKQRGKRFENSQGKSGPRGPAISPHQEVAEEDEDGEGGYDIDDKSSGEHTNTSSPATKPFNPVGTHAMPSIHNLIGPSAHKNGLETPGRFASNYGAPPPISQRHLLNALANIELQDRPGERGAFDDIHSQPNSPAFKEPDRQHNIPQGRSELAAAQPAGVEGSSSLGQDTRGEANRRAENEPRKEDSSRGMEERPAASNTAAKGKAKAFAFFGQDDSGSDLSDGTSE